MTQQKKLYPKLVFYLICLLFVIVWGPWNWKSQVIFDSGWWFDEAGHAVFGFFGAIILLYLARNSAVVGSGLIGERHLISDIVGEIAILGVGWEAIELGWDLIIVEANYLSWLSTAQKNSIDTTADLIINPLFAFLAMAVAHLVKHFYQRLRPEQTKEWETQSILGMLKYVDREIRFRRLKAVKRLEPILKKLLREIDGHGRTKAK